MQAVSKKTRNEDRGQQNAKAQAQSTDHSRRLQMGVTAIKQSGSNGCRTAVWHLDRFFSRDRCSRQLALACGLPRKRGTGMAFYVLAPHTLVACVLTDGRRTRAETFVRRSALARRAKILAQHALQDLARWIARQNSAHNQLLRHFEPSELAPAVCL